MIDHQTVNSISAIELIREAIQLIRGQYARFVALSFALLFIAGVSPFGVLTGPAVVMLHVAIAEAKSRRTINLHRFYQWTQPALEGLLAYMMMLACCFLLLSPITLAIYLLNSDWENISQSLPFSKYAMVTFGAGIIPTVMTIQLTACLPFLFTFCEIIEGENHAIEAMKRSITLTTQNISLVVKFSAILITIHLVGIAFLVLPAVLFLPVHFAMIHVLYDKLSSD